jgi:hypothetical protein
MSAVLTTMSTSSLIRRGRRRARLGRRRARLRGRPPAALKVSIDGSVMRAALSYIARSVGRPDRKTDEKEVRTRRVHYALAAAALALAGGSAARAQDPQGGVHLPGATRRRRLVRAHDRGRLLSKALGSRSRRPENSSGRSGSAGGCGLVREGTRSSAARSGSSAQGERSALQMPDVFFGQATGTQIRTSPSTSGGRGHDLPREWPPAPSKKV